MADLHPVPVPRPGPLFGHAHTYGVAHDLERMRQGLAPPPRVPRMRTRPVRYPGRVRRWWAVTERRPGDLWHRIRCRAGHHEVRGGHQMQLGNRFVWVERRCRWCDAPPPL